MEVSTSSSSREEKEALEPEVEPVMPQKQAAEVDEAFDAGEVSSSSPLSSSTNWVVAGGLLQNSIAFDTSESVSGPEENLACPKGSVFLKAPGDELIPCEVNVCFSQKHEIHRVYVRSTARVFEMYYAPEEPIKNNEYLCTVRCGSAGAASSPESDAANGLSRANSISETMTISPTNNINEEDGWVEVKMADAPVFRYSDTVDIAQTFYEATAEITDVDPCISLTLRLLSLHEKGSIEIAEIYIYADPVPNSDSSCMPFSMTNNLAGSALFSMLAPGLFPLQKLENSRRGVFEKLQSGGVQENEKCNLDPRRNILETSMSSENSSKINVETPSQIHEIPIQTESSQHASHLSKTNKHVPQGNEAGSSNMEDILLKLVSRIDVIENICLRFEEKMTKPLSSIEARLGQLELQLGILTARSTCHEAHEHLPSSRIAAPEFSCDTSESGEIGDQDEPNISEDDTSSANPFSARDLSVSSPGLVVRVPEFELDDECLIGCNDNSWLGKKPLEDLSTPVVEDCTLKTCNGSSDSVNLQEDAATIYTNCSQQEDFVASTDVSVSTGNINDNAAEVFSVDCTTAVSESSLRHDSATAAGLSVLTGNKNSSDTRAVSIDSALNAALEALMSSSCLESSIDNPQTDTIRDESDKNDNTCQTVASENAPHRSDIQQLFSGTIGGKSIMDFVSFGADPSCEEGKKGFGGSRFSENYADETTNEGNTPSQQTDGTNDHFSDPAMKSYCCVKKQAEVNDSMEQKACLENSDGPLMQQTWIGESSTDSLVDGIATDHSQVIWSDGSSAYSEEEVFPLPKWLAGRLDSFNSQMENTEDAGGDSSHVNGGVSALYELGKSNLETRLEREPILDDTSSILDVKFSCKVSGGSYFEDLLGEASSTQTWAADYRGNDQGTESVSWNSSSQCAVDMNDLNSVDHQNLVDIGEVGKVSEASDTEVTSQDSSTQVNREAFPSLI